MPTSLPHPPRGRFARGFVSPGTPVRSRLPEGRQSMQWRSTLRTRPLHRKPPHPLQPPLELVRGTPSGASTTSASAVVKRNPLGLAEASIEPSFVTAASPPPSHPPSLSVFSPALRTYVEPAGRTIGLFRTPSPLAGTKHTLTPSPPSLTPSVLPTSPPPAVGRQLGHKSVPADWRDWIRSRREITRGQHNRVFQEDLDAAAAALTSSPPPPL